LAAAEVSVGTRREYHSIDDNDDDEVDECRKKRIQ